MATVLLGILVILLMRDVSRLETRIEELEQD